MVFTPTGAACLKPCKVGKNLKSATRTTEVAPNEVTLVRQGTGLSQAEFAAALRLPSLFLDIGSFPRADGGAVIEGGIGFMLFSGAR